jgi:Tfp pilus assembly protein PilF
MQAILKIRKVAEDFPNNLKAQFTLGVLSLQTGQYERATERFTKVLELDDSRGEYWRLMAEANLGTGDTVEARKNFEKALQLVNEETGDRFKEELPTLVRN